MLNEASVWQHYRPLKEMTTAGCSETGPLRYLIERRQKNALLTPIVSKALN